MPATSPAKNKLSFLEFRLFGAAREGAVGQVKWLCTLGVNANLVSHFGNTPLMSVCTGEKEEKTRLEICKILVDHGADVNKRCAKGYSALHKACISGHSSIVDFLVSQGADVEAEDFEVNATPLNLAVYYGHLEIVTDFFNVGNSPYPDFKYNSRWPLLHTACSQGRSEVVNFLLDRGASPLSKDCWGRKPIHVTQHSLVISSLCSRTTV